VLLQQRLEGFSPLRGKSNASQLPCLLRGERPEPHHTSLFIPRGKKEIILNFAASDLEKNSSYLPLQYLFDSTKDISVLQCGHTIHLECMNEMRAHHQ